MKKIKLFAISLGLMTSFCVCNNAFSGPLEDYIEEFNNIKALENKTNNYNEIFKYKQELGELRNNVLSTIEDYTESNISTEKLKKLYRELEKYSIELDKKLMRW